jgi:diguanylate cyclase (GGDEF)-like protein/PAS domain S-box-containing protein
MFPLLRYFSIASLVAVIVTTALLSLLHQRVERVQLLSIGESNHVALTQSFANSLLPSFRELAETAMTLDTEALKRHPLIASIDLRVRSAMQNARVVKVKFYDTQGRTIFSTDATQIGRDYRDNAGFISALQGRPLSELTHRDRFSAFDQEIVDRDVLSSYVAMRASAQAPAEGVLEVYSDVTDWIEHTNRQAWIVTLATILAFSLLYAALYFIVQRADGLIRTQYRELRRSESELRVAATAFESQEAMMVTDAEGRVLRVNHAFTEITGYTAEEVVGKNPRLLKTERHDPEFYRAMWQSIAQTGSWQGELWDRRKNGEEYPEWLTISAVKDSNGVVTHYVGAHLDITERKKAEEQIKALAFYDQLTGLPNRTLLLDRIEHAMTLCARSDRYGALMFIDLDHFKAVNDLLGHDAGDILLQQVARRLQDCIRACDTAARWGGDEFVVMLENLAASRQEAMQQLDEIGNKILAELNQPYQLGDHVGQNTPSIGAVLFDGKESSVNALLKLADELMYQAKDQGRNGLVIHP